MYFSRGLNFCVRFRQIHCRIWVKFGVRNLPILVFSIGVFSESGCRQGRSFRTGVSANVNACVLRRGIHHPTVLQVDYFRCVLSVACPVFLSVGSHFSTRTIGLVSFRARVSRCE